MSNYLGIDFGTKRMGLAWSDDLNIALPIGAIPGVDSKECMKNLSQEIEQRKIDQIVIGYPIHMDGKKGKRTEEVDHFITELKEEFGLVIHRVDERLTSHAAEQALGKKAKTKKGRESGKIDATAACLILTDFLNRDSKDQNPEFC